MLILKKYTSIEKSRWDDFIKSSYNGSFLHERNFMEYHKDRFQDHSFMVFDGDILIACIPAHINGGAIMSHRGLTYGGLIIQNFDESLILAVLNLVVHQFGFEASSFELNLPPEMNREVALKLDQILMNYGFKVTRDMINMHVDLTNEVKVSSKKTAGFRNGLFDALVYSKSDDLKAYWNDLLIPALNSRHDSSPIHSLREIESLRRDFPQNMEIQVVTLNGNVIAGVLFFIHGTIVKSQYAASNAAGLKYRAMDFLYLEAMKEFSLRGFTIMDNGTVYNTQGNLNKGLLRFKKELGSQQSPMKRYQFKLS